MFTAKLKDGSKSLWGFMEAIKHLVKDVNLIVTSSGKLLFIETNAK